MKGRRLLAVRAAMTLAVLVLAALALRRIDWPAFLRALAGARVGLVLLAAAINFLNIFCKSQRWRVLLLPLARLPRLRPFVYMVVGYGASQLLPLQAGEGLRLYLLRRRDGVPLSSSMGTFLAEKLLDVLGLLLVVAPLPLWLELAPWMKHGIAALCVAGVGGSLVFLWLWLAGRHVGPFWGRLGAGLAGVRRPGPFLAALGWTLGYLLVDACEIRLVLEALRLSLPLAAPLLVLLTVSAASLVPAAPAQIGTLEAGAVLGLHALGVPLGPALCFGLLYHVMQGVPVLVAGIAGLRWVRGEVEGQGQ